MPEVRDLEYLALSVLDDLAEKLSPADFEKVVEVRDALSIDSNVTTPQKRRILAKLVQLFNYQSPSDEITPTREGSWQSMLKQHNQFSNVQKERVVEFVNERYGQKEGEDTILRLLSVAEAEPKEFRWLIRGRLLQQIVSRIDFSGSAVDEIRIRLVTTCQELLTQENARSIAEELAQLVAPATRTTLDAQAQRGIAALHELKTEAFAPEDLDGLAKNLVQQGTRAAVNLRGGWLKPLLHLYEVLPASEKDAFEKLVVKDIENPADPKLLISLLETLEKAERNKLLSVEGVRAAFRRQAANLEKFGAPNFATYRRQLVNCFAALDLANAPEIFDDSKEWDILVFIETVQKAAKEEGDEPTQSRGRLLDICNALVVGHLPGSKALYDAVCKAAEAEANLVTPNLAEALCAPAMSLFESNLEVEYSWFHFWKEQLRASRRAELMREASDLFLRKKVKNWIATLQFISSDLTSDEELRQDQGLVKELFDYAFNASEEDPAAGVKPLLELLPYLGDRHLRDYIDRALDTLITYEARKDPLARMEPFLRMIEAPGAKLTNDDLNKAASKFCRRMLGPSNTADERTRILTFLTVVKRPELVATLKGELEQLTNSEDAGTASAAQDLLRQVTGS
jgi:hypothetical protein